MRLSNLKLWLLPLSIFVLGQPAATLAATDSTLLFIGTYSGPRSKGIYSSRLDAQTGKLTPPELAAEARSPSFLALHPNRRYLYAVGEVDTFEGKKAGAVSAFSVDSKSGKLTLLNQQSSGGPGPCHLAVDRTGQCLLVANYGGGSIEALPIETDGRLSAPSTFIQHQGSSVNKQRQAGPHAHFTTIDPANRLALVCDLGLDKVLVYRLNPAQGSLTPNDPPSASVEAGAGPRHLAFHPNGRFVYVINEMKSTVTALAFDAQRGVMTELHTVSTLPEKFSGNSSCAEIAVHPSGRFVYGSNRGHDSIVVFAVDSGSGKLSLVEHQSTQGKTPRHFALDPEGKWLLAENQNSDSIVVFGVDGNSGRLSPTDGKIDVGSPVCVQFVPGD
jgi:6-phosphogluconolactonase